MELQVGADLQYIRNNGTIVGGSVGCSSLRYRSGSAFALDPPNSAIAIRPNDLNAWDRVPANRMKGSRAPKASSQDDRRTRVRGGTI